MKISRWIYYPLIYTVACFSLQGLVYLIFDTPFDSFFIWFWLVSGVLLASLNLYSADTKAREVSKNGDARAFDVRQNRNLMLLLDYEKTFNTCLEAIISLKRGKIENEDFQQGKIKAKSRLNRDAPAQKIEIQLSKVNENLTEVEVLIRPAWKTVIVSSGESWKTAEDICGYLKTKDAEINRKVLVDSAEILNDVYVKPFQKENV